MFRRNRELRQKVLEYLDSARDTIEDFERGIHDALNKGRQSLEKLVADTHARESVCDQLRQRIELDLFEQSLLPETREDLMLMLERLDLIVNQSEDVLRSLWLQQIELPAFIKGDYQALVSLVSRSAQRAFEMARQAIAAKGDARAMHDEVDAIESNGDRLEQTMIRRLFEQQKLPLAEKMLVRDVVQQTGQMAALAEDAADWILIFVAKQR
jgi:predicted phosphate transport protein (TIGR00153 family)